MAKMAWNTRALEITKFFNSAGFGGTVALDLTTETLAESELRPFEVPVSALPARRTEFATGRALARRCLVTLGQKPQRIERGPDRAPIWPEGLTGSISHTAGLTMAVVWAPPEVSGSGIGIDVEQLGRVEQTIFSTVFTAQEREMLSRCSAQERDFLATGLFSAKEALFKAQYPLTQRFIDYQEVEFIPENTPSQQAAQTLLRLQHSLAELEPYAFHVFFKNYDQFVVSGAIIVAIHQPGLKWY